MKNSAFLLTFNLASLLIFIYNYAMSRANAHSVRSTDHDVVCSEQDMVATWNKNLFSGDLYRLELADNEVYRYNSNATHIWLTMKFDRSGTTIIERDDVIILKNTVKIYAWNSSTHHALIVREDLHRYNLQCVFPRRTQASSRKGYSVTQHAIKTINTSVVQTFDISLDIYNSSSFERKAINPIVMNAPLYVEIRRLGPNDKHFKMVTQQCFASPYSNHTLNIFTYPFFYKRCIIDSTFRIIEANDRHFRFSINAFQLKRSINFGDVIYLHCKTFMCRKNSTSPMCQQTCSNTHAQENRDKSLSEDSLMRGVKQESADTEQDRSSDSVSTDIIQNEGKEMTLNQLFGLNNKNIDNNERRKLSNISGLTEVQHTASAQIRFARKTDIPKETGDESRFMTSQSFKTIVEGKMKYVFIGLFVFALILVIVKVVHYYKCCYQGIEA